MKSTTGGRGYSGVNAAMRDLRNAKKKVIDAMEQVWTVGSTINVHLKSNQINPTTMQVLRHNSNGTVTCSMPSKKTRSGEFIKDIYYTNICR